MSLSVYYPISTPCGPEPQVTILAAQATGGIVPMRRPALRGAAQGEWDDTFQYLAFERDR
jgi:hypothetical protein